MTVDGQETVIDAVIIEGCNDARFTVIRPEVESELLDTLYLDLAGSAVLGLDYSDTFNEVIMTPGQTESEITLGVVDDGADEGVEFVEITYEYINGCGELISTTSKVVILDPIPVQAIASEVDCQSLDGTQVLGYDNISGYGPFNYVWDGNVWNNALEDPADWVTSFDSLFTMTDAEGQLQSSHIIELIVVDQCGKSFPFEQEVLYPVMTEAEICGGAQQDFPAFNSGILVEDVLYNGISFITGSPDAPLTVDVTANGERWKLNGISADVVEDTWQGTVTLVDTCGYETEALIRVRDCVVPNVFTPDGFGGNNTFRIRGLDGFMGSRLVVYNRYGTVVFQDETATDAEFELFWDGRYANGTEAPEGSYQWVLLRADGLRETGELTLLRQN